jgi:hypothetical protein
MKLKGQINHHTLSNLFSHPSADRNDLFNEIDPILNNRKHGIYTEGESPFIFPQVITHIYS